MYAESPNVLIIVCYRRYPCVLDLKSTGWGLGSAFRVTQPNVVQTFLGLPWDDFFFFKFEAICTGCRGSSRWDSRKMFLNSPPHEKNASTTIKNCKYYHLLYMTVLVCSIRYDQRYHPPSIHFITEEGHTQRTT